MAILIGRWQMWALLEALDPPLYQFKGSAANQVAIMSFELTTFSLHKAGDARFVCNDKMAKRTIFWAIPMAPTY